MKEVEGMWTIEDEHKIDMMIAFDDGKEKGIKEGEKIGMLKTASNLLSEGIPIEIIMKTTHLTKNEIQNFKQIQT